MLLACYALASTLAALPAASTPIDASGCGSVPEGRSFRLDSPRGPVHLWAPRAYAPRDADLVVYVHGYYTDVDRAWCEHRLPQQFRESGRRALFVAIEAPSGPAQQVAWPDLDALVDWLGRASPFPMPQGRVLAIGHSGAYRTLLGWVRSARVDDLVMLDAVYCSLEPFKRWLRARTGRRLLVVGRSTAARAEAELPAGTLRRSRVPASIDELEPEELRARVLYWRSQFDHGGIVTRGEVLPVVLRWSATGSADPEES